MARGSSSRSRSGATSPRPWRSTRRSTQVFAEPDDLPHRPLPGQGAGPEPALLPLRQLASSSRIWNRQTTSRASRSTCPRLSTSPTAAPSTTRPGAIRDVVQNHLLQVLSLLAMEPPSGRTRRGRSATSSSRSSTRSAPLASGRRRARPVPRLPRGRRRRSRLDRRDVRGAAAARRHAGAGAACRSTSAPASACRSRRPRSSSS